MAILVIGASSVRQLEANMGALSALEFSVAELAEIDQRHRGRVQRGPAGPSLAGPRFR